MLQKLLAVMPVHTVLFAGLFGLFAILSGLGTASWWFGMIYVIGGIFLVTFGMGTLIARVLPKRTEVP